MNRNKKYFAYIFILFLFTGLFFRYLNRSPKRHYCDFRVYHATAQRFLAKKDIYSRPDPEITPYKYSPMFAFLVSPLGFLSRKAASLTFFTLNFICLLLIFILSKKMIVKDKISYRQTVFLYSLTAIFSFRFMLQVLDSGQVGILILALVVLGLYFIQSQKKLLTTGLISLSIFIKYMSALFIPYFLLRKKYKITVFILIFIVLFCVLPALYLGIDKQIDYTKSWLPFISDTSLDKGSFYSYKNQSIYSLVLRYFTKGSSYGVSLADFSFYQGLLIALGIAAIIYLLILIPSGKSKKLNVVDYSLLFLSTALFNPNAWMHNFIVFIFAYLVVIYYLIKVDFKDRLTVALVFISFLLASAGSESIVGDNLETLLEQFSSVAVGTLILMVVLFRLKFKKLYPSE
ncbi:MAG: DUF2029 domain-containing protein [Candidatus Omnitrophica bacterium]|nr:DUF2029 domain-containing protein [Candidatus Omnitrophota bacterium]